MKIERTCPRCREWRYHPSSWDDETKAACEIWCAECGHRWNGRLTPDERQDFVAWKRRNVELHLPTTTMSRSDVQIRGKLGTHSTAIYFVQDSDEAPSAGDRVMVRSDQDGRVGKWTEVEVHEIKFGNFFYLGLV